jgi:hypothetical protein
MDTLEILIRKRTEHHGYYDRPLSSPDENPDESDESSDTSSSWSSSEDDPLEEIRSLKLMLGVIDMDNADAPCPMNHNDNGSVVEVPQLAAEGKGEIALKGLELKSSKAYPFLRSRGSSASSHFSEVAYRPRRKIMDANPTIDDVNKSGQTLFQRCRSNAYEYSTTRSVHSAPLPSVLHRSIHSALLSSERRFQPRSSSSIITAPMSPKRVQEKSVDSTAVKVPPPERDDLEEGFANSSIGASEASFDDTSQASELSVQILMKHLFCSDSVAHIDWYQ